MAKIKDKERNLNIATEKKLIKYKGTPRWLSAHFSEEILQAREEWHYIFKVMKGKNQEHSTKER